MKKYLIIAILIIIAIIFGVTNQESILSFEEDIKILIQGENNKKPVINLSDNIKNNKSFKTYDNNGISFNYPSYWNYNYLNKVFSLGGKEELSRWDDGLIFYTTDKSLKDQLKEEENNSYSNRNKTKIANKNAYILDDKKGDYYQLIAIVEKNENQTYVFTFFSDLDKKSENKYLFMDILKTMNLK